MNLLDWSALALPAGFRSDGLPFGITFIAPAWSDLALCELGERWQRHVAWPRGATGRPLGAAPVSQAEPRESREPEPGHVRLAVVGAHLTGMPLNRELTDRHAVLVERATTSTAYRLYALAGTVPPKPGLARAEAGAPIDVELWDMPTAAFGSFVAGIPAPLGIGTLELADGRAVKGSSASRGRSRTPWTSRASAGGAPISRLLSEGETGAARPRCLSLSSPDGPVPARRARTRGNHRVARG